MSRARWRLKGRERERERERKREREKSVAFPPASSLPLLLFDIASVRWRQLLHNPISVPGFTSVKKMAWRHFARRERGSKSDAAVGGVSVVFCASRLSAFYSRIVLPTDATRLQCII